ncbi:MAG: NAD(P)H-dependent oxidoreductase [Candidatus Krumholzibacteria bacterium]|nr:NAD(P)H-dependent oxidoreductase [Candidatus Krumholzibacteria bacterium]
MAAKPRILAFAGSARTGSYNKLLVRIAAAGARAAGAETTYVDMRDFPMPLYDADLEKEQGMPENARKFKELMIAHDGLLISSPENNSTISALLKNVIDWASRPAEGEPPLAAFDGKVAAIMSASPGTLGGLRGLAHVRAILESIRVMVLPDQKAISGASSAFDAQGHLVDRKSQEAITNIGAGLARTLAKLNA